MSPLMLCRSSRRYRRCPAFSLRAAFRVTASDLCPAFEDMKIAARWAGLIDVTPDAVPVISPISSLPGFFLASGFSGHGFGIGPASGRLVADLATGDRPIVDPAPFRIERLARVRGGKGSGAKLRPGRQ